MRYLGVLCFIFYCSFASADYPLIPTEILEDYFISEGVTYTKYPYHIGVTGDSSPSRFVFLDYQDPADTETLGLFFEFSLGGALSSSLNTHLFAALRGPVLYDIQQGHIEGRGLAIGHLGTFFGCQITAPASRGFLIEDWSAWHTGGGPYSKANQATPCQMIDMPDNSLYRVDIHVSLLNASVAIWKKSFGTFPNFLPSYEFIGDSSCIRDSGSWCEEFFDDGGNAVIGVHSEVDDLPFLFTNIFIAQW